MGGRWWTRAALAWIEVVCVCCAVLSGVVGGPAAAAASSQQQQPTERAPSGGTSRERERERATVAF